MALLVASAVKDFRRRLADVPALGLWLGLPLLLGLMLYLMAGGGARTGTPKATVLVVDQDQGVVSQLLGNALVGGDLASLIAVERVSLEEGRRRMDRGEASAMVVLPPGLGDAVLRGTDVEVPLVTNPAQRILPGLVQEVFEILAEIVFYAQQVLGDVLRRMAEVTGGAGRPVPSAEVGALAAGINERLQALEGVLLPPVLRVVPEDGLEQGGASSASATGSLDFGRVFLPGLLLMSVLFIAQGASTDLWEEKRLGTLRRARALPGSMQTWLAGKFVATSALVALVGVMALLVGWLLFGVPARTLPLAFAWTWLAGVALSCYFLLLQVAASSERGAQLLGTIVAFPLVMIGGSFFPFETMPAWMAAIGRWTPNGLAVVRLREILDGRAEWVPLLASLVGIAVPAIAAFLVTARRIAGRFPVS